MDTQSPQVLTIPARLSHTATVIFVHGLGQSNISWRELVAEALAPNLPNVSWILPQAPSRSVSLDQGQLRPSWFKIGALPPRVSEIDQAGLSESISLLEHIILSQIHSGIQARNIVLVGFSQGAALCLATFLTSLYDLGGVASLSGWLPPHVTQHILSTHSDMPILWCHGSRDVEIPLTYARTGIYQLGSIFPRLTFKEYPSLGHTINDEELYDLVNWLKETVS